MDTQQTNPRAVRGLQLAKTARITKLTDKHWVVPSQSHKGKYVVDPEAGTCMCPDFETRGGTAVDFRCKHIFAVLFARHQVTQPDGTKIVAETMRITYAQDWPRYNRAQVTEKEHVQFLLKGLCEGIMQPERPAEQPGRRPLPLSDVVYGTVMKVYTGMSGRRASTDVRECEAKGHIDHAPSYNTLFSYIERPELMPLFKALVEESATPLKAIETNFAVDATGFSTSVYRRWFDHKYGKPMREAKWVKAHAMVGVTTGIVSSIEVTEGHMNDAPQFAGLVATTAQRFPIAEVSADKAYLSHQNLDAVAAVGAVPYIPFKSNSKGAGPEQWRKLWHLFSYEREKFLRHYHHALERREHVLGDQAEVRRQRPEQAPGGPVQRGPLQDRLPQSLGARALDLRAGHRAHVLGRLVTPLEIELRISLLQAELLRLADQLDGKAARAIRYAAKVLRLARC